MIEKQSIYCRFKVAGGDDECIHDAVDLSDQVEYRGLLL